MNTKYKRPQSIGEEIGNSITHGVGFLLSVVASVLMIIKCDNWQTYVGVILFSLSMMMLYLFSCLYHSFKNGSKVKRVFKRFDHLSIYLLISGTFAPILLAGIGSTVAYVMFAIQWFLTILGIISKCIWPNKYGKLHVVIFLIIGWSGVFLLKDLYAISPILLWYIIGGGISYSIGVIFYALYNTKYFHFIWHFFVLLGTILQFIGIYFYIL